ncbi:MAG: NusG domain II-containing protein [Candidatus Wallacebacter cryptica]|nr:NusG domain II-containing protein [Bacillota bacterium]
MRIRKGDLLIFVVLMIIGFFTFYNNFFRDEITGNLAILEIDGEIVEKFNLETDLETYRVETEYGYNVLEFADGSVSVVEADCPDQICVHFGWIKTVGQTIVCLPHKLIIRIANETADLGLDGVAY